MIANQQGQTVWRWDNQEPFARDLPNDDPGNTGNPFVFNLRFPGQYFERETGLSYNVMRDYDPGIGRYIQSDPIGLLGGSNTYLYVAADPLIRIDPKGLLACFNVADCYGQANANPNGCTRLYNSNIACTVAFARCLIVARSPTLRRVCLV